MQPLQSAVSHSFDVACRSTPQPDRCPGQRLMRDGAPASLALCDAGRLRRELLPGLRTGVSLTAHANCPGRHVSGVRHADRNRDGNCGL
jgi:hypothetical protein